MVHETPRESRPVGILIANSVVPEGTAVPQAKGYSAVTPLETVLDELRKVTGKQFRIMTGPGPG